MDKKDLPANDAEFEAINKDFNENVVESGWSENGELIYVLKDEADLEKYARSAKIILNSYWEPELDFVCKVMHADGKDSITFNCEFDAKHLLLDEEFEDDEPMTVLDELEDFKGLWPHYFLEKLNPEEDFEYPVGEGIDLAEMGNLILNYIKASKKVVDIPIKIVLINMAGEKEVISIPVNI